MFSALARSIFGSSTDRVVKNLRPLVDKVNALEPQYMALTDDQLRAKTAEFKERVQSGTKLDDIMVEAFAVVREGARRALGMRHFDVQLIGGMVLHQGKIAEMKTGEGKTLVGTLPVYLNALAGKGVHVVTVNDYLAKRDSDWMGQLYQFLGLSVGCIVHGLDDQERRDHYARDITYGTNNEFGFDYLRDNMKYTLGEMCQRPFFFAIVDEVDSILIDEARTPLIISGAAEDSSALYRQVNALMPILTKDDYEKDEKQRSVVLTEQGVEKLEAALREAAILVTGHLYDMDNISINHHIGQAMRAHLIYARDVDYIVKDDKIIIIDEFTGRMMPGRRYGEGAHQAIEAKENVTIQKENQTLASITYQNYFRLYPKLAGMTGTANTEAAEFQEIYKLEVVEIPTNVPVSRKDSDDLIYRTANEKYDAIANLIEECQGRGQPVLVGTTSIEKSELISAALSKRKIKHNVLNARQHEQEAYVVAQAGSPGAVTVATNMAGRGTDIKLGGNVEMRVSRELTEIANEAERENGTQKIKNEVAALKQDVLDAGGLFVLGTERHESRRIDNQLRGRSGRQGDPGASRFFVSLEDDLMRIFGAQRLSGLLQKLGLKEGEAIFDPWITKAMQKAQTRVEAVHFDARKQLLKFDDVMNDQRKVIYEQRRDIMTATDISDIVREMRHDVVRDMVAKAIPKNSYAEQWQMDELQTNAQRVLGLDLPVASWKEEEGIADAEIVERLIQASDAKMADKFSVLGEDTAVDMQRMILMQIFDSNWKEHLLNLDYLRQGIGLRSYGQKDPLNEYKAEAFGLFQVMLHQLREQVTTSLSNVNFQFEQPVMPQSPRMEDLIEIHEDPGLNNFSTDPALASAENIIPLQRPVVNRFDQNDSETWKMTQRNAPCPCGSGKKYKQCHGAI